MEKLKQFASVCFVLSMFMIGVYSVSYNIMTWTIIKAMKVTERVRNRKLERESNEEEV